MHAIANQCARHSLCEYCRERADMAASMPVSVHSQAGCKCLQSRAVPRSVAFYLQSKSRLVQRCEHHSAVTVAFRRVQSHLRRPTAVRGNLPLVMASSAEKTVLVPLGNGTEEMEAVTIIDVFRRAGAKVTVASVESDRTVTCSRDVKIIADELIGQAAQRQYDLIVLPVSP